MRDHRATRGYFCLRLGHPRVVCISTCRSKVHPSSDLASHGDRWIDSSADHAPACSPPISRSRHSPTHSSPQVPSHPLSYALAAPQNTNAVQHRSRRPRFSRCFQRPVLPCVARDVGTACKKGPSEPSHLYNISPYCTAPRPPQCLGRRAILTHAKAPSRPTLPASAKRPLSAPSI